MLQKRKERKPAATAELWDENLQATVWAKLRPPTHQQGKKHIFCCLEKQLQEADVMKLEHRRVQIVELPSELCVH